MVPPGPGSDAMLDRGAAPDDWPPLRPYPTRPYPTRRLLARPYPTRPNGAPEPALRPYPTRPYPTRPYPTRPYPTRPYPTRAYDWGPTDDDADALAYAPDSTLDPAEWTADVSELFCARSAVIRIGATVVAGVGRIPVPRVIDPAPDYLARPEATSEADEEPKPQKGSDKPLGRVQVRNLAPGRSELAWKVAVPDDLARELSVQPEPAWALKDDIATNLARRADREFLQGGPGLPGLLAALAPLPAQEPDAAVRAILAAIRGLDDPALQYAGWILSSATLDRLAVKAAGPRTWDSTMLLTPDGADGGMLLGYPFVVSPAAGDAIYFSADWSELWIGVETRPVTVAVSEHAHFQSDETVIRAVSQHDVVVRRPELFAAARIRRQR
jgi:Phage capsid family